jgi:hypothetical protein
MGKSPMDPPAEFVIQERVTCVAVEGEIGTIEREQRYLGCWKCSACSRYGVSAATYWNRSAAVAWARAVITAHATKYHPADPSPE